MIDIEGKTPEILFVSPTSPNPGQRLVSYAALLVLIHLQLNAVHS
jgi:hypothetical protein